MPDGWAGSRGHPLSRFRVPHVEALVRTGGNDEPPVRGIRDPHHLAARLGETAKHLAGGTLPDPHALVTAAGCQPLSIGCERHGRDAPRVSFEAANRFARCGVPEPEVPVPVARRDGAVIACDVEAVNGGGVLV